MMTDDEWTYLYPFVMAHQEALRAIQNVDADFRMRALISVEVAYLRLEDAKKFVVVSGRHWTA